MRVEAEADLRYRSPLLLLSLLLLLREFVLLLFGDVLEDEDEGEALEVLLGVRRLEEGVLAFRDVVVEYSFEGGR